MKVKELVRVLQFCYQEEEIFMKDVLAVANFQVLNKEEILPVSPPA